MDVEEPAEGLDDLRKRRLAYFETLNQSTHKTQDQSTSNGNLANVSRYQNSELYEAHTYPKLHIKEDVSGYKESAHELEYVKRKAEDTVTDKATDDRQFKFDRVKAGLDAVGKTVEVQDVSVNGFREKHTDEHVHVTETNVDFVPNNYVEHTGRNHEKGSSEKMPLKTSSFYFSSPENESQMKRKEQQQIASQDLSKPDGKVDELDAYNETVERLIRATKEEILGVKVSDDIWTNFRKEKGDSKEHEVVEDRHEKSNEKKMQSDVTAQSVLSNTHNENTTKYFRRSLSETDSHLIAQTHSDTMKSVDYRQSDVKQREHRASFSHSSDSRPMYSNSEPVSRFNHVPEETRKSSNSAKIEEIFSSRQMTHSQIPNKAFIHESQELEPVREVLSDVMNQSEDFGELGLSTHRPDSERTDDARVEADDINLGDTVTKELRILLGEEKFNQFLMKAKKDIDDLHQSSNENSARKDRTPRLLKDTPTKVNKFVTQSKEFKEDQPKSILKNKESVQKIESTDQVRIQRSLTESKEVRSSIRDSSDFTPRQTDAEAVENLIGEYVLTKQHPETNKRLPSKPAYKMKKNEVKKNEVEENVKVSVPALDLEDVTKAESPRPKLNRPKYEPPTIYQDRSEREPEHRDKHLDKDLKTSTNKNYEQTTVPRNVAFSANEIYSQAYGALYSSRVPMGGSQFHHGPIAPGQYGSPPGMAYSTPLTPSTLVGPVAEPHLHSEQFSSRGGFLNYSEEFSGYKDFARQTSYTSDRSQIPHQPNQQGLPINMPYSSIYASTPDFRGYAPNNVQRFAAPVMSVTDQPFHTPHPPPTSVPFSQGFNQANVSVPMSYPQGVPLNHSYQYAMVVDPTSATHGAGAQALPGFTPTGVGGQVLKPHPPTSVGAQLYQPGHAIMPTATQPRDARPNEPPPTPTTSNAEVQTDREESNANEEFTVVEESAFTSVSQIVDDEKFVPHPPASKKEGGPSPRRPHHKLDLAGKNANSSKRHIDGIRQHHEQRRQEHEEEKMAEDQIIERQKKFAKASLDRYFSSLENIYTSSSKLKTPDADTEITLPDIEDEDNFKDTNQTEKDVTLKTHDVIDDVMSSIPMETEKNGESEQNAKNKTDFEPVVHGFIDFSETEDFTSSTKFSNLRNVKKNSPVYLAEKENHENDNETLVNSNANTDVTLKGGGLTERLNELGIDVAHVKHSDTDGKGKAEDIKKGEKKGKVLIVCPECQGLNKEYMSWCTQCGEMIIGVEPMLVSKNREGKLRMKPLNKEEFCVHDDFRIRHPNETEIDTKLVSNGHEVNYVQELDVEKPFTLNLEGIRTDKNERDEHLELFENKKVSPIKSDGKDSGRPSSDDPELDLQTQKIEEEVVNDICASISDPVLKGYVKSHFSKSKQSWQEHEGKIGSRDFQDDVQNLVKTVDVNKSKNSMYHDVVDVGFDANGINNTENSTKVLRTFDQSELKDKHRNDEDYNPAQYKTDAHENVKDKIAMFNQKQAENIENTIHKNDWNKLESLNGSEQELEALFEPPPLPNFSSTLPVSRSELALKLPANSMDYSTDMSQVVSHNFEHTHKVDEKGDNVAEESVEERELKKAERRKERRRKRGHGAIDVEVFGYEESRESRNSSRANRMVPLLNLAGNSSDEDDSVYSDFKPIILDSKQEVKQNSGSLIQVKSSVSAWGPAVIHEETFEGEDASTWQQPVREEENNIDESSLLWRQPDIYLKDEFKHYDGEVKPGTRPQNVIAENARSPELASPDVVMEVPIPNRERNQAVHLDTEENEDWKHLFDPNIEIEMDQEPVEVPEDDTVQGNQPFLMQLINQPKPQKTKKKPKSARGKPVKSKVRQSLEEAAYQRKWARSSIAWTSYNQGELNTSSSLRSSSELTKARPASAPKSRSYGSTELQASASYDDQASGDRDVRGNFSARGFPGKNKRPVSAPKSRIASSELQASVNTDEAVSPSQDGRGISPTRGVTRKSTRPVSAPKSCTTGNEMQASVNIDDETINDNDASGISPIRDISGKLKRPASAPKSRVQSNNLQASINNDDNAPGELDALLDDQDVHASQFVGADSGKKSRPFSADLQKRKVPKRKNKKGGRPGDSFDLELDLVSEMVEHRLPKPSAIDRLSEKVPERPVNQADPEHMASPRSTYDKYIEMTPRIQAGTVSRWQCLPDEILLHVFSYLDQSSLTKCAQVCQQYYRVAMDESLWKYITIKKSVIDDSHLDEIARRHPVSLALIQCHGEQVSAKGLRDLFRQCAESLKELNVARCSRGALTGDSLLLHAAARCHNLTHIDTSWCSLTDSGLMAISNTCHRLESLCINGCNAVSNDGLETVIKKHGSHLRVLEMFGCFNLSPRGLRSVANNCINLITLNLGQCYKLTDSCISQLSTSLGRVESLDLRGCKQIKDNCMRRVVKNCSRLKHLSLANCPSITDVSVLEISTYLTDIRSLDLCGCKNITDGSIRALVNTCTNLRHIDISSTSCTHRSVSMIANFSGQRLETLKINFLSDVTEQSLIKLAKHCRRLNSVHMYGCPGVRNVDKVKEERPTFIIEM